MRKRNRADSIAPRGLSVRQPELSHLQLRGHSMFWVMMYMSGGVEP